MQYNKTYNALQYNNTKYNTMQYNTTTYNKIPTYSLFQNNVWLDYVEAHESWVPKIEVDILFNAIQYNINHDATQYIPYY